MKSPGTRTKQQAKGLKALSVLFAVIVGATLGLGSIGSAQPGTRQEAGPQPGEAQGRAAILIGKWHCTPRHFLTGEPAAQELAFDAGNYKRGVAFQGATLLSLGTYSAKMLPGNLLWVHLEPADWYPREYCAPFAGCTPLSWTEENWVVEVLSWNSFRDPGGMVCQRVP